MASRSPRDVGKRQAEIRSDSGYIDEIAPAEHIFGILLSDNADNPTLRICENRKRARLSKQWTLDQLKAKRDEVYKHSLVQL